MHHSDMTSETTRRRDVFETKRRRDAFLKWMEAEGLTVAKISQKSGVPDSTLRTYVAGKKTQSLMGSTQERIATAFDVTVSYIFGEPSPIATVGVFGRIGARADVFPADRDGDEPLYDAELPPGLDPDGEYVAFEIEGFSMPPAEPGWIVIFRRKQIPLADLVGFPCMVELSDGRRLFKRLRRGYEPGRWNLESWDGSPPIEDVEILSALPFASLAPGTSARK